MNNKDLIIAVLATFCLTATLFIILPIRGQTGDYDPWVDLNDDGSINILESILVGNHFLTNGDPTKSVYVTNWPGWSKTGVAASVNLTWNTNVTSLSCGSIDTAGYSRLYLSLCITDMSNPGYWGPKITTIYLYAIAWEDLSGPMGYRFSNGVAVANDTCRFSMIGWTDPNTNKPYSMGLPPSGTQAIDVGGPYADNLIWIFEGLQNIANSGWMTIDIYYYLRNE